MTVALGWSSLFNQYAHSWATDLPPMPTSMSCCLVPAPCDKEQANESADASAGISCVMDTNQFIASLVSSLAWPAAVVCIAVLFRTQLKTLLTERLRHIEAGPLKADFDLLGSEVHETLGKAGISVPDHAKDDELADLANQSPRQVISVAFDLVAQELRDALTSTGEPPPDGADAAEIAHLALGRDLISPLTINAIEGLAVMHNLALHGPRREITRAQVDEYLALVEAVLYAIRQNIKSYEARQS